MNDVLEILSDARTFLLSKLPFYGVLAMRLHPVIDESVETMAVDGKHLIICPNFIKNTLKNRRQLLFVLVHEVLHLALGHLWRCGVRNQKIWNYACDYVVNGILWQLISHPEIDVRRRMREWLEMPEEGLLYAGFFNMTAEEVYKKLITEGAPLMPGDISQGIQGGGQSSQGGQSGQDGQSGGQSGQSGKSNSKILAEIETSNQRNGKNLLDNHDIWTGKSEEDRAHGDWMIAVAASIVRCDGIGDGPNCYSMTGVPNAARKIIEEFFNPTKSWRQILAEYAEPCDRDYTFQPPDSRYHEFDFFLPDEQFTDEKVTGVYFWCDNSRSVGEPYRILFASELVGAFMQFGDGTEIWYGLFDAYASEPQELFVSKGVESMLGCGTNPKACFDKMKELGLMETAKCIVFLTDGKFGPIKKEWAENVPVIWALVPDYIEYGRRQLEEQGWERIIVLDREVED